MAAKVPMLAPDGSPVFVAAESREQAEQQGYVVETPKMETQRHFNEDAGLAGRIAAPIAAGGNALASALTFGGSDVAGRGLVGAVTGGEYSGADYGGAMTALAEGSPIATGVGTATGMIAPLLMTGGLAGAAGAGVRGLSRGATLAGEALGGVIKGTGGLARAGRGALSMGLAGTLEGAAYGAGAELQSIARSEAGFGDPAMAAERLLAGAGHGALLGGLLGGGLGAGGSLLATAAGAAKRGAGRLASKAGELGAELPGGLESLGRLGSAEGLTSISREFSAAQRGLQKGQARKIVDGGGTAQLARVQAKAEELAIAAERELGPARAAALTPDELLSRTRAAKEAAGSKIDDTFQALEKEGNLADIQGVVDKLDEHIGKLRGSRLEHEVAARELAEDAIERITQSTKKLDELNLRAAAATQRTSTVEASIAQRGVADSEQALSLHLAQKAEKAAFQAVADEQQRVASVTWKTVRDARKTVDNVITGSVKNNPMLAASARDIRSIMEGSLEDAVNKTSAAGLYKAAKTDYNALRELEIAGKNLVSQQAGNLTFGLTSHISGGAGATAGATIGSVLGPIGASVGGAIGGVVGGVGNKFLQGTQGRAWAAHFARRAARDGIASTLDSVSGGIASKLAGLTRSAGDTVAAGRGRMTGLQTRAAAKLDAAYREEQRKTDERKAAAQWAMEGKSKLADVAPMLSGAVSVAAMRQAGAVPPPVSAAPEDLASMARPHPVSEAEQARYVRQSKAVQDPRALLDHAAKGTLTHDEVEAVRAAFPVLYADIQSQATQQLTAAAMKGKSPSYARTLQLSTLLGVPLDASLRPGFVRAMQGVHAKSAKPAPAANRGSMRQASRAPKAAEQAMTDTQRWY